MDVLQPLDDRKSALQDAIRSSTRSVMVISPFIDVPGVKAVVGAKPVGIPLKVLTRLECEVIDPDAIELLLDAGARFKSLNRLHSKVYVVDEQCALFGSANLTGGGLSTNHELLISANDETCTEVIAYAADLWRLGTNRTEAWVREQCKQARLLHKKAMGRPLPEDAEDDGHPDLDLVYIPKNAKERMSSFNFMLMCADWSSAEDVRGDEHVENVRDILDFGAYLGLLGKRGVHVGEGPHTTYKLTRSGTAICRDIVNGDRNGPKQLSIRLVEYAMPNRYINFGRTPQHQQCSVRPWLTMLRLLASMENHRGYSGNGFSPKEMAFTVLSVFHESPREMQSALRHLKTLDAMADAEDREEQLNEWIVELGLEPQRLWQAKAGIPVRLCRWPLYTGLVTCATSNDAKTTFSDLIDSDITIRRVTGLTTRGRRLVEKFKGTMYAMKSAAVKET